MANNFQYTYIIVILYELKFKTFNRILFFLYQLKLKYNNDLKTKITVKIIWIK